MRTSVVAICLLMVVLVLSCATAPKIRTIVNSFEFTEDFDSVWSAVVETFAEMNFPIDNLEKDSGIITTDWISFNGTSNSGYCDCGGLGLAIEQSRRGKFNVFVRTTDAGVTVKVNCVFSQVATLMDSSMNRDCVSTGHLEAKMDNLIRSKVR
ncbi:MAG: outer membrane protein assembly factor BamC [bacterium]|nr:outer membrane protein assembly factor BamC [bacterium]